MNAKGVDMSTNTTPDYPEQDPNHPKALSQEEIDKIKAKYNTGMTREDAESVVRIVTEAENITQDSSENG